jgi:hypothetical protein
VAPAFGAPPLVAPPLGEPPLPLPSWVQAQTARLPEPLQRQAIICGPVQNVEFGKLQDWPFRIVSAAGQVAFVTRPPEPNVVLPPKPVRPPDTFCVDRPPVEVRFPPPPVTAP